MPADIVSGMLAPKDAGLHMLLAHLHIMCCLSVESFITSFNECHIRIKITIMPVNGCETEMVDPGQGSSGQQQSVQGQ